MVNCPPEVVRLTIDLHKHLVQMPLPVRIRSHPTNSVSSDLSREHWAKSVPPEPNCFMAYVDATFVQKIFDVAERERKPNVHHDRQADDLRARFEVPKWIGFCHPAKLRNRPARLKLICSDSTIAEVVLPRLFAELPTIRLDGPTQIGGWAFRGPTSTPVAWGV